MLLTAPRDIALRFSLPTAVNTTISQEYQRPPALGRTREGSDGSGTRAYRSDIRIHHDATHICRSLPERSITIPPPAFTIPPDAAEPRLQYSEWRYWVPWHIIYPDSTLRLFKHSTTASGKQVVIGSGQSLRSTKLPAKQCGQAWPSVTPFVLV
jgi:hypothetical protein